MDSRTTHSEAHGQNRRNGYQMEYLWRVYDSINNWIRFSDTKAGAILVSNGLIVSLAAANSNKLGKLLDGSMICSIFVFVAGVALYLSTAFCIMCLLPTLKIGEPNSLIFFAHVAKKYDSVRTYEAAVRDLLTDDTQLAGQIIHQIWANSKVAWKKYKRVTWATRFYALTIGLILVSIVAGVV